jgi:Uma2 family endonuclease
MKEGAVMVELKFGMRTVDLPFTIRIPDVTDEMFDELVDEDTKAELLDGVMIVHSPASPRHNLIAGFLRTLTGCYVEEKGHGRVFGPDNLIHVAARRKFAPDAFFLTRKRVPRPLPRMQFDLVPDMVVEVLSPSNRDDDLQEKRPAYQQAKVPEVWWIDPDEQTVLIDRLRGGNHTTRKMTSGQLRSTVVRGFWLDLAWLWDDPLPKVLTCLRAILK